MAVKVSDLKPQSFENDDGAELLCQVCGGQYSANAGDYFNYPPKHIFKCCEENMVLAVKEIRWKVIKK